MKVLYITHKQTNEQKLPIKEKIFEKTNETTSNNNNNIALEEVKVEISEVIKWMEKKMFENYHILRPRKLVRTAIHDSSNYAESSWAGEGS